MSQSKRDRKRCRELNNRGQIAIVYNIRYSLSLIPIMFLSLTPIMFSDCHGTEAEPFKMREYLVLNLVTSKEICALATVDVKNNRDTNEKVRGLLLKEFKDVRICPASVQAY